MSNGLTRTKKVAISASVVLGSLGIGGASFALLSGGNASAASSTSTNAPATPNTAKVHKIRQYLRRHAVHSTVTVKTKDGYETINLARGTISAISSGSITVQSADGTLLTATIDTQTKFHNTTEQQLTTGEKVGLVAYGSVARLINVPKAAPTSS
jgi:hypothetical protein